MSEICKQCEDPSWTGDEPIVAPPLPHGEGGTSDFNELDNRPKYDGAVMSGNTNIPKVETYRDFVGTDGEEDGEAGLVPAPEAADAGKFLKADGTWAEAGGGGPTVVQTTGTSTTDVMSQKAVSERIYPRLGSVQDAIGIIGANETQDAQAANGSIGIGSGHRSRGDNSVAIGAGTAIYSSGAYSVAIGSTAKTENHSRAVALGNASNAANNNSIALGTNAVTTRDGELNVGAGTSGRGYNSTNYRLIGGVHDPIDAHDAATKGYVDSQGGGGDPVYSTKTTSNQSDGGAVFIGPLNASQTPLTDPTTTDNHYRYFWAMPFDINGQDDFGIPGNETINIGGRQNSGSRNISIGYRTRVLSGESNIVLGYQAEASGFSSNVVVGDGATSTVGSAVVIGRDARTSFNGTVALGAFSQPTRMGEVNVGTSQSAYGYNSTKYRVIGGVHDGVDLHDAASVAQGNTLSDTAPTTSTVGVLGQLYTDTTTMHTYQCTAISGNTYTWTQRW